MGFGVIHIVGIVSNLAVVASGVDAATEASSISSRFDWVTPLVSVSVAVVAALAAWFTARVSERRRLYAEAISAALLWVELLYRVRRRGSDNEEVCRSIVDRFHDTQEKITFYEAWVGSENEAMRLSYKNFTDGVKAATGELIREAWDDNPRPLPGEGTEDDLHPERIDQITEVFLNDVRARLSPWRRSPSVKSVKQRPTLEAALLKGDGV